MVRGAYIQRATSDRMTVKDAMERYLSEVVPTKRPTSQVADRKRSRILVQSLGKYSLTALTPEVIAQFRDFASGRMDAWMVMEAATKNEQHSSS